MHESGAALIHDFCIPESQLPPNTGQCVTRRLQLSNNTLFVTRKSFYFIFWKWRLTWNTEYKTGNPSSLPLNTHKKKIWLRISDLMIRSEAEFSHCRRRLITDRTCCLVNYRNMDWRLSFQSLQLLPPNKKIRLYWLSRKFNLWHL